MQLRNILKRAVKVLFLIAVYPLFGLFSAITKLSGSDRCFATFSQSLSVIPGKFGTYMRAAFYRLACPETSDEISVGFLTLLSHRDTSIARGVYIGPQCNIGMCSIGAHTLIGSGVHILSGSRQHAFNDIEMPIQEQGGVFEKIRVGEDCWIGNQAIIMASVDDKSIVAAGSVVVKLCDKGDVVAGNPGRRVKNRLSQAESGATQQGPSNHV